MKKLLLLFGGAMLTLLSGCANIDCVLEDGIRERAGIEADSSYTEYRELLEKDQLDSDGTYTGFEDHSSDDPQRKAVHVTFAQNSCMNITYYTNEEKSEKLNANEWYLDPGDSIYADKAEIDNSGSSLYEFAEYQIYEITEKAERRLLTTQKADGRLVYTIPADYTGNELQIVPIGKYEKRKLNTEAYYFDSFGKQQEVNTTGQWTVNGSKDLESISAVDSYILKYEYDSKRWFFVEASPKQFTQNPDSVGYVEFYQQEADSEINSYSIELHPMISLTIQLDKRGTVSVNGGEEQDLKKGAEWTRDDLKYGNYINIVTEGNCTITPGEYRHVLKSENQAGDQKYYRIDITRELQTGTEDPDIIKTFRVVLNADAEYGKCTFELDGKKVDSNTEIRIRENQKLTATYKLTDKDYEFNGSAKGIKGKFFDLLKNERTATIPVTAEMDGKNIRAQDYFDIRKKQ